MAQAASVISSVTSGHYTTAQEVTLSTTEATGEIYYTLDGTTPTSAKTKYTEPIELGTGTKTTIKAVTVTEGKDNSEVLTLYVVVEESFLAKIRRAVRRNTSTDVDAELTDIIAECRADLISLGVTPAKANSETDSLILGAVRCFARWKFGLSNEDAEANREDYMTLRDELRRRRDYTTYAVTFSVVDESADGIEDAVITFNGESQETDSNGGAVFYYVQKGVNQKYTVVADDYMSQEVEIDITGDVTVTVTMEAK
jgi:hypothetical protein